MIGGMKAGWRMRQCYFFVAAGFLLPKCCTLQLCTGTCIGRSVGRSGDRSVGGEHEPPGHVRKDVNFIFGFDLSAQKRFTFGASLYVPLLDMLLR